MKNVLNLYKKVGWTPLEAIEKFKTKNPAYKSKRMGYAGRLDPMAEGVLLVLSGEENKKIAQYMGFDKEYVAEILLGFSSDSNDVLGIASAGEVKELDEKDLKKKIKGFGGKYDMLIPKYSSYKVKGKPMFHYARKGIEIGEVRKKVIIKKIGVNSIYQISNTRLMKYIEDKIGKVNGDFRQKEIVNNWKKLLKSSGNYYVLNVTLSVSSGTYIRAIADDFGSEYGGGLLLSLKRTKVGKFGVGKSVKI